MKATRIISFSGKMHSGKTSLKDAVAGKLRELGNRVEPVSFATPLKDAVDQCVKSLAERGYIRPQEFTLYQADKSNRRPEYQLVGQVLRKYDANVWANLAVSFTESFGNSVVFVNDDLRFPNEVMALRNTDSFIVRLECDRDTRSARAPLVNEHDISETALDEFQGFDLVLDSGRLSIAEEVDLVLQALWQRETNLAATQRIG